MKQSLFLLSRYRLIFAAGRRRRGMRRNDHVGDRAQGGLFRHGQDVQQRLVPDRMGGQCIFKNAYAMLLAAKSTGKHVIFFWPSINACTD